MPDTFLVHAVESIFEIDNKHVERLPKLRALLHVIQEGVNVVNTGGSSSERNLLCDNQVF